MAKTERRAPALFTDFIDNPDISPYDPAGPEMEDREILFRIWAKLLEQEPELQLERFPDYAVLAERYPDEGTWTVLFLYRRILESDLVDIKLVPELLTRIEQLIETGLESLRDAALSLALLLIHRLDKLDSIQEKLVGDFISYHFDITLETEGEAFNKLDTLEREAIARGHGITLGGRNLGLRAAKPRSLEELSYDELKVQLADRAAQNYRPDISVHLGDFIRHPKFGDGFVTKLEKGKAQITFPDNRRVLKVL
jgi:hypothetical protein